MSNQQITVSRPLVGAIALVCFVAAGAIGVWDAWESLWCAAFVRVGLLMGAFWLALPSAHREAAWANVAPSTIIGALLAVFVVARWRAALPIVIGVGVIAFLVKPRNRRPRP